MAKITKIDKQAIIDDYAKRVIRQTIITYVAMFFLAYTLISLAFWDVSLTGVLAPQTEMYIALGIAVVLLGFSFFHWRCPNCHRFLGIRAGLRACPYCRVAFKKDEKK